jgi:hypothetical protein
MAKYSRIGESERLLKARGASGVSSAWRLANELNTSPPQPESWGSGEVFAVLSRKPQRLLRLRQIATWRSIWAGSSETFGFMSAPLVGPSLTLRVCVSQVKNLPHLFV